MNSQPVVFLSYAREDRQRVEDVYDSLRAAGLRPWLDSRDIAPGEEWSAVIGRAMREADFLLLFISRNSVSNRGYLQREIQAALSILSEMPEGKIFLIPVRLDGSDLPERLAHIQFVDLFQKDGWNQLLRSLKAGMEQSEFSVEGMRELRKEIRKEDQAELSRRGPYVFVAMPFSVEMEDIYVLGIKSAVHAIGLECVRVDETAFTGDILDEIKRKIAGATAVVAELTGTNPNVHLELGYAWGTAIPTVLLLREGGQLCFDVRGQRCLVYRNIVSLQAMLTEELSSLKASGRLGTHRA
jgi:hypothetical protein